MSLEAMTWAFKQPLRGNAKVILLALADHANDDGECWPSMSRIAAKASVCERTVQRVMLDLADEGYLSFVGRSASDGRTLTKRYLLHMGQQESWGEGDKLSPGEGDIVVTGEGDTVVTPNEPSEGTINKSKQRGARVPEDFWPNEASFKTAASAGLSKAEAEGQVDAFLDYWRAVPGAKGLGADWQARFRTWLRNHVKFSQDRRKHGTRTASKPNSLDDTFAKIRAVTDEMERREKAQGYGHSRKNFEVLP